jgi:glycosyltransferase involved in cell wall biosynthesis
MRKLLIDAAGYKKGKALGVNSYLDNLLTYFSAHRKSLNYDRVIVVCDKSEAEHFKQYATLEVRGLDCSNYIKRFWVQNRYASIFHLSNDDLILWPHGYSSIIKRCHFLLVMHDLLYLHPDIMGPLKNTIAMKLQKIICPISFKKADKIITITKWVKKDLMNAYGTDSSKIFPIYNYFNFSKYGDNVSAYIKQIASKDYFLVVSADYPHKHVGTVIKAFSIYAKNEKEASLYIVGRMSKERKEEIEKLETGIKQRIFLLSGISNDDLAYLYRHCRSYINATEFEGLGMPFVEAMYFGCKVIASDIEVVREVTGDRAVYFDYRDENGLAQIMANIDNYSVPFDLKEFITTQYSAENTSGKYIEVINSLSDINNK